MNDIEQNPDKNNDGMKEYRKQCLDLSFKAQEDYDKGVMTLSGGGLGISLTFIDKFIQLKTGACVNLLFTSWIFWILSLCCVLYSYYSANKAMLKTVEQIDSGKDPYEENRGGIFNSLTHLLNICSGVFFVLGIVSVILFVFTNIK